MGIVEKLKSAMAGKKQLAEHTVAELEQFAMEARSAITASRQALKEARRRDLAGVDDAQLQGHADQLTQLELRVKRDVANERVIVAALTAARGREEAAALERDAAAIGSELRDAVERYEELTNAASVARLRVRRLAGRLCAEQLRRKLDADPTEGLRPRLRRLLGTDLPAVLQQVFDSGEPLPMAPPGPKAGDRRRTFGVGVPGGRAEIFRDGEWQRDEAHQTVRRRAGVVHPGIR